MTNQNLSPKANFADFNNIGGTSLTASLPLVLSSTNVLSINPASSSSVGVLTYSSTNQNITFTGPCSITNNIEIIVVGGHLVQISFPFTYSTSTSATYFSSTSNLPSSIFPSSNLMFPIIIINNSGYYNGLLVITTTGQLNIYTITMNNFSATGNAGFTFQVSYAI
jgi:hypothetical protein